MLLVFKALSIRKVFSLTIQPNRKTIITTEVLSFLSVEKIIHYFHLIQFTGLTLHTETNDNNCACSRACCIIVSYFLQSRRCCYSSFIRCHLDDFSRRSTHVNAGVTSLVFSSQMKGDKGVCFIIQPLDFLCVQ